MMQDLINCLASALAAMALQAFVSPLVIVAYVPVTYLFEVIRRRYIATARELKRLDSIAVSPVLSSFTETLQVLLLMLSIPAWRCTVEHVLAGACLPSVHALLELAMAISLCSQNRRGCKRHGPLYCISRKCRLR